MHTLCSMKPSSRGFMYVNLIVFTFVDGNVYCTLIAMCMQIYLYKMFARVSMLWA